MSQALEYSLNVIIWNGHNIRSLRGIAIISIGQINLVHHGNIGLYGVQRLFTPLRIHVASSMYPWANGFHLISLLPAILITGTGFVRLLMALTPRFSGNIPMKGGFNIILFHIVLDGTNVFPFQVFTCP